MIEPARILRSPTPVNADPRVWITPGWALGLSLALCFPMALIGVGCAKNASSRPARHIEWADHGVWLKADLHAHSRFSDGARDVRQIAAEARRNGCQVLAITDHSDATMQAATREYFDSLDAARQLMADIVILGGLEWNIPPFGGKEHASVLVAPDVERTSLPTLKVRFDDLGANTTGAHRSAEQCFEFLDSLVAGAHPVVLFNHPSRGGLKPDELVESLTRWRQKSPTLMGFEGAPGHQHASTVGGYTGQTPAVDRWDPVVATVGGVWDQLLAKGLDLWGALASSDFHNEADPELRDDWPGQFSETWIYAREKSPTAILEALRAGSFFANHLGIARQARLTVRAGNWPRGVIAGESAVVDEGERLEIELFADIPVKDLQGKPNHLDLVELIAVTESGAESILRQPPARDGPLLRTEWIAPAGSVALRARGRRQDPDGSSYWFYTNPIRIDGESGSIWSTLARVATWTSSAFDSASGARFSGRRAMGTGLMFATLVAGSLSLSRRRTTARSAHRVPVDFEKPIEQRTWKPTGVSGGGVEAGAPSTVASIATMGSAPSRGQLGLLALLLTAAAIYGSLVPLHYRSMPFDEAIRTFKQTPYYQLGIASRADWVSNIVLFVPLGFFWLGTLLVDRRAGVAGRAIAAAVVVAAGVGTAMGLEFTQLFFPPRTVSQNDIIAESMGGAIGAILWLAAGQTVVDWLRRYTGDRTRAGQLDFILQAYALGLVMYSLLPLDLTIEPEELARKYREGKILLNPFDRAGKSLLELLYDGLVNALLFVPIGMLAARGIWSRRRATRSPAWGAAVGFALALALEGAQLIVYSRYTVTRDVLWATLGSWAGAAIASRRRGLEFAPIAPASGVGWRWLAAAAAYAGFLLVFFWAPFDWTSDSALIKARMSRFASVPLEALYRGSEFNAVTQLLRKGLLFAPLGAFLMRSIVGLPKSIRRVAAGVWIVAMVGWATLIELGQIFLPVHTADVSDVLLCSLGGVLGLSLTARFFSGASSIATLNPGPARTGHRDEVGKRSSAVVGAGSGKAIALIVGALGCVLLGWNARDFWSAIPTMPTIASAKPLDLTLEHSDVVSEPMRATPPSGWTWKEIEIPSFPGAYAIWGATGRDRNGRVWIGVSAHEVPIPSARLFEVDSTSEKLIERGNVVDELRRLELSKPGEGQMKIHSKIVQGADGHLYFTSHDEQGEDSAASRLGAWGSHLWRYRLTDHQWEHVLAAPQGLISVGAGGGKIYALGYFNHVVFQLDLSTGTIRHAEVGSLGGHVSRNLVVDDRGHVFVPRVREGAKADDGVIVELVELDAELREVASTPMTHYLGGSLVESHGIVGIHRWKQKERLFVTDQGFLYHLTPGTGDGQVSRVDEVGWLDPKGTRYTPSLFAVGGRWLVSAAAPGPYGPTDELITYDWDRRSGGARPLEPAGIETVDGKPLRGLILYGSMTRDERGRLYFGGVRNRIENGQDRQRPILLRAEETSATSPSSRPR